MKKNDKRKIRIWKKTFALALSSVMIFSCIPMTQVKAGDESPEAIINGLVDLPKTFIDKDSQDLGSDRVFYRNTNTDLSMLPEECYKKALQSYIIDDDVPMGTRKGDYLLSDWDYLGWILSVEKGQGNYGYLNDTLCNMTIYGNRRKSEQNWTMPGITGAGISVKAVLRMHSSISQMILRVHRLDRFH